MRSGEVGGIGKPGPAGWGFLGLLLLGVALGGVSCRTGGKVDRHDRGPSVSAWEREVERWMGTPYRWGGDTQRGVDCSGFVQQVHFRVSGVRLPRTTAEQFKVGTAVARRELRPGDLVFFETTGRGVSHVGLSLGGDRFAHASQSRGVVVAGLGEAYWTQRYLGARRVVRRVGG
ncbi:MAG: C40 family peptidase [Verrucomicrobiae bacterium]|nr:C40 family peptidase [Verrucomicrobiae bacterium]